MVDDIKRSYGGLAWPMVICVSSLVMIFNNEDVTMFIIVYFMSILYNTHVYLFVYLFL